MIRRKAFTLMEVLISIALLSLVLLALYRSLGMLRASNSQLFEHLAKANEEKRVVETLFLDIASSDGNISIKNDDEFSRLCIESTLNSLYALPIAKVCWVVTKKDKELLRSEGNYYNIPLKAEDRVAVDSVMGDIELFRTYHKGSEVLVLLQQKGKESISFIVDGIPKPIKKRKKVKKREVKRTPPKIAPPQRRPTTPPKSPKKEPKIPKV
jgi:prepilin-type N-terminal cleavage/methylation domain-containing protein